MTRITRTHTLSSTAVLLLLASCSGGQGSSSTPPSASAPPSGGGAHETPGTKDGADEPSGPPGSLDRTFADQGTLLQAAAKTRVTNIREAELIAPLLDPKGFVVFGHETHMNTDGADTTTTTFSLALDDTGHPGKTTPGASARFGSRTELQSTGSRIGWKTVETTDSDGVGHVVMSLVRFGSDMALDRSFGSNGSVTLPASVTDPGSLHVDAGDRIVVTTHEGVMRLTPDGQADNTFGKSGFVTIDFGDAYPWRFEAMPLPDGTIAVFSGSGDCSWKSDGNASMVRVLSEHGALVDGPRSLGGLTCYTGVLRGDDGALYLSGNPDRRMQVARFDTHLALDSAFGKGGIVSLNDTQDTLFDLYDVDHEGRLYAAWDQSYGAGEVKRYTAQGLPDEAFPLLKSVPIGSHLFVGNRLVLAGSKPTAFWRNDGINATEVALVVQRYWL